MSSTEFLDRISDALSVIDDEVWYGVAAKHSDRDPFNYTVFSRDKTSASANLTSYQEGIMVAVVRENYIPEGMDAKVIDAMTAIPGVKLDASKDIEYRYDVKPGTTNTIEMMVVYFRRGRKR